jgi:hypothetical protein
MNNNRLTERCKGLVPIIIGITSRKRFSSVISGVGEKGKGLVLESKSDSKISKWKQS